MTDIVTLLRAVSANGTGTAADAGGLKNEAALAVTTTGTVSAFSVQLQVSIDNVNWVSAGSPVTTVTTSIVAGPLLARYFRAVLSGYAGTGTVSAMLAFTAGAGTPSLTAAPSGSAGGDLGGTYPNPTVTATHLTVALPVAQGGTGSATRNFAGLLTPTAVKTSAASPYTAAAGDLVPVDTTTAAVTVNLPSAPADNACVAAKLIIQGTGNNLTVNCSGSDVFNKTSGSTSMTLSLPNQAVLLQYKATGGIWYVLADDLPLGQLDARYGSAIGTATGATPAITASTAGVWNVTLTTAVTGLTVTASPAAVAQTLTLYLKQNATGGWAFPPSAWPGSVVWLSGTAPVIATTALAVTVVVLETTDGGTTWYGAGGGALPAPVPQGGTGVAQLSAPYAALIAGAAGTSPVQQQVISCKPSVMAATATALPNGTAVYNINLQSLTGGTNGVLTVDGITVVIGDRVLVQDEATAANNGIYVVTTLGTGSAKYVLTRANDMTAPSQVQGAVVFAEQGTVNAGCCFAVSGIGPWTTFGAGATAMNWVLAGSGAFDALGAAASAQTAAQSFATTAVNAEAGMARAAEGAALQTANSLSELASSPSAARGNLGLGAAALLATPIPVASGGTGQTTAGAAFNALSPNTTLGDITYGSGASTSTRLAGNTTTTKKLLAQTGDGTLSAAPAWSVLAATDLPAATTSAQGAVILEGTAANITAPGLAPSAGTSTKAPAADHGHPALSAWTPADCGVSAWNYDPMLITAASALTAGVLFLHGIQVHQSVTVTKIYFGTSSSSTGTSAQCWAGLYSSAGGAALASVDITTRLSSALSMAPVTISSTALTPGLYWVGLLMNGTLGNIYRCNEPGTVCVNFGTVAATSRYGQFGTAQTTLPSLTTASITANDIPNWCAIGP